MAAQQKRLLTSEKSQLGKTDLVAVLRQNGAWSTLPLETRQHLYTLLPAPELGEPLHDANINPLNTNMRPYLEEALRRWQEDLREGRHGKKWRDEALRAGRDRVEGKFEEWKQIEREQYWGKRKAEEDEQTEAKISDGVGEDAKAEKQLSVAEHDIKLSKK